MAQQDVYFAVATIIGTLFGALHLCWGREMDNTSRGLCGRCAGVFALLCLGLTGFVAAGLRSPWLGPVGLLAGLLIVAMLWERPEATWETPTLK